MEVPTSPTASTCTFDDLYTSQFGFVWRCLRGLGVPTERLDDAAQDVFVIVHRQLSSFRGDSSVGTWLFGITRKVAFNHRRSSARKQSRLVPLAEEPMAQGPGPLEIAQNAEAAAFVQSFMDGIDDDKRALFLMAVLEEMSIPEVAEALGVRLNTAYTRLRRVRIEFERALAARKGKA